MTVDVADTVQVVKLGEEEYDKGKCNSLTECLVWEESVERILS